MTVFQQNTSGLFQVYIYSKGSQNELLFKKTDTTSLQCYCEDLNAISNSQQHSFFLSYSETQYLLQYRFIILSGNSQTPFYEFPMNKYCKLVPIGIIIEGM